MPTKEDSQYDKIKHNFVYKQLSKKKKKNYLLDIRACVGVWLIQISCKRKCVVRKYLCVRVFVVKTKGV